MGKFGSLAAAPAETFRVEIIYPATDKPIRDKEGKVAFIEVLASDGAVGRAFDKEERAAAFRRARRSRSGVDDIDPLDQNVAKCAALTKSWYLVDPETLEKIDVPCTVENAKELYSQPGMNWLFIQPWVAANDAANFMKRSAPASTPTPSTSSETAAS